jgi:hypothetical protein
VDEFKKVVFGRLYFEYMSAVRSHFEVMWFFFCFFFWFWGCMFPGDETFCGVSFMHWPASIIMGCWETIMKMWRCIMLDRLD